MSLNRKQLLARQKSDMQQMLADRETTRGAVLDGVSASATKAAAWFNGHRFPNLFDLHQLSASVPVVAVKLFTLATERSELCVGRRPTCGRPGTLGEGLEQSLDIVGGTAELAREYSKDTADRRIDVAEASRLLGLIDRLIARLVNLRQLISVAAGQPVDTRMRIPG